MCWNLLVLLLTAVHVCCSCAVVPRARGAAVAGLERVSRLGAHGGSDSSRRVVGGKGAGKGRERGAYLVVVDDRHGLQLTPAHPPAECSDSR